MNCTKRALAAISLGGFMAGCAAPSTPASTPSVGRYQLAPGGNQVLDTTTGELFLADYDDGTWQKQVAPVAMAKPRPAPTTQATAEIANAQQQPIFNNVTTASAVAQSLRELERSKNEGILTADEYTKARGLALAPFGNIQQLQLRNYGPERLHDELVALKKLRDDNMISAGEYERVRSAMVQSYLARE